MLVLALTILCAAIAFRRIYIRLKANTAENSKEAQFRQLAALNVKRDPLQAKLREEARKLFAQWQDREPLQFGHRRFVSAEAFTSPSDGRLMVCIVYDQFYGEESDEERREVILPLLN